MRHRLPILLGALAAVSACAPREEPPQRQPVPPPSAAQRMKVLAADVFVIDGQHVRLAESYGPQGIPDARCWAEALAAKLATQQVRALVTDARDVAFTPTGERDEYNRVIAHVSLDTVDLGRTLRDVGLAAATPKGRFEWCEPISKNASGAPPLNTLMDLGR